MLLAKRFLVSLVSIFLLSSLFLSGSASATVHNISIVEYSFNPPTDTVAAGDSVKWTNDGAMDHTSTSDASLWDSGTLVPGATFTRQFTTPGSFGYHCAIHTFMTATIVVKSTAVNDGNPAGVISKYSLNQNFPNPFNSSTRISYYLEKKGMVKLEVYNVLGQKIRTLVEKFEEPGLKTLSWDGKDDKGLNTSTGIYFYRLITPDFVATRKMVYLK